jgi:hypothetical protein
MLFFAKKYFMMKQILFAVAMLLAITAKAQPQQDKKIIDKLCGCFNVDFKYAETFSPDTTYKFHNKEETPATAELALPIEVTDNKIAIQHLLIVGKNMIIKHWREEWTFENTTLWKYKGDRTWEKTTLPKEQVKGKWTQTIWEVADEPRYQGISQFVHLDNKIIWQSTTDAPLPRREYSVRNDYNILNRTNRLNITDSGYIHEQDNKKIIRNNGVDKLLVEEKGYNNYVKINDNACAAAKAYWETNKLYWGKVRNIWNAYLSKNYTLKIKQKIDDVYLHENLIQLCNDFNAKKITEADIDAKISAEIKKYM